MYTHQSFETAAENMAFDRDCIGRLVNQEIPAFLRIYTWQQRGLTQSEKRPIPTPLQPIDHAYRSTGGGIVFHCPGDIVFATGAPIHYNKLPTTIKERCDWMSEQLAMALQSVGVPVTRSLPKTTTRDAITFCSAYHNPYELVVGDNKIVGIAVKRTRQYMVFQGVIHVRKTALFYPELTPSYTRYFTAGCQETCAIDTQQLCAKIKDALSF